ncbi:hypothetical protein [Blastococcus saxobsidens]|uniref:DUF4280 domain-containing protein n=1 Tax=Blastococcus saxobsidens (strain DD2) TaxID=1146883 RepID=H6RPH0_BLASD|nr:hypothetical protein [Blastococcus saxobsidens]CCG04029.1 conserved protein of unknown function [Blastococcus saxobsidens DD2]
MPGPILHSGAVVTCTHGGQATPSAPMARVTVSGMPVATLPAPWTVAGCPFVPTGGNGPCATGQWTVGATRVMVLGQPVVLQTSSSTCVPTGTPLLPVSAQTRVIAT